jgi:hypothetical protein
MKFELKNEYVKKGSVTSPSTIVLPSGVYKIIINPMGKPVKENYKCNFTKIKTNCVIITVGFVGINVCGDILITMVEMGYDLESKDDWKRAKKEEKEKIVAKYDELVSEKPELFDASKVDLNKLEEEVKKREEEKAAPEEAPVEQEEPEAEEERKCKFEIEEGHIQKGETGEPSLVILPSGICEVLILTTTSGKSIMNYKCKFTKINTNCVNIDVGFTGTLVCGDILITMKEMGYDLASKDDWKRAKKEEKEKIVAKYDELVSEKPELFDAARAITWAERLEKERARKEKRRQKRIASKEKKRKEKLSERKEKLSEKYGEVFALAMLSKTVMKGMSPEMVYETIGQHNLKYKKDEEYYFSVPEDEFDSPDKVNRVIIFKNGKVEIDKEIDNGICLHMHKGALIASWGEPDDKKENVSIDKVKLKYLYGKSETDRGTTKYKTEVNLENDLVVGWKDL